MKQQAAVSVYDISPLFRGSRSVLIFYRYLLNGNTLKKKADVLIKLKHYNYVCRFKAIYFNE